MYIPVYFTDDLTKHQKETYFRQVYLYSDPGTSGSERVRV